MAPEQARSQKVDGRSDLFSLGAVLYRMATGRTPFDGHDTMSILMSLANDTPADPRSLNRVLPPHIASLINRLLDKDPAKRPQSAREVVQLLAPPTVEAFSDSRERRAEFEFEGDDPTLADVPMARPAEPKQRQKKLLTGALVGAAAAIMLLVGGGFATYKLVFESKNGTLIVEVDRDADVRFKDGKIHINDENGKWLYTLEPSDKNRTLPPGQYQIKVTGADGLKVNTSACKLEKGKEVKVYVIVDPAWRPVVVAEADRKAAEYILSIGGTVRIVEKGKEGNRRRSANYPAGLRAAYR